MDAKVYIDNVDILATYGLRLGDNSIGSLIEWPALKEVYYNDWYEEDGIEPDLSNPVLDTRECTLVFSGNTTLSQVDEFIDLLTTTGAYHKLSIGAGFVYTLRLVRNNGIKWYDGLCVIKLTFADDKPLDGYVYQRPSTTVFNDPRYLLDYSTLTSFGVNVLEGINDALLRLPDVKPNLMRSYENVAGVVYDDDNVRFEPCEVRIPCLMRSTSLKEFKNNYHALLYTLTRPGARTLGVTPLGKKYQFHYVSQHVNSAFIDDNPWVTFDIVINVFTPPTTLTTYELDNIQQE